MDCEIEKKLTEQQHQIDMLRKDVEAGMKVMESENEVTLTKHEFAIKELQSSNEKAIGGLRADNEKAIGSLRTDFGDLRTDMEKNINSLTMKMIGVVVAGVAVLGGFIAILQFLK